MRLCLAPKQLDESISLVFDYQIVSPPERFTIRTTHRHHEARLRFLAIFSYSHLNIQGYLIQKPVRQTMDLIRLDIQRDSFFDPMIVNAL